MKLINCTPHVISIYDPKDCVGDSPRRLYVDKDNVKPRLVITPCGVVLNAQVSVVDVDVDVDLKAYKDLFVKQSFKSVDNPLELVADATDADLFIVSALYKTAAKAVGLDLKLASVQGVVYDAKDIKNPRPCGCLKLDLA